MLLEFLVYSSIMIGVVGALIVATIHMYVWRNRVTIPLITTLCLERIIARMERDMVKGPCNVDAWNVGEGIVGWFTAESSCSWRLRGQRLWYEHDGSRVPVLDGVTLLKSVAKFHKKKVQSIIVDICYKGQRVSIEAVPRASVVSCSSW